MAKHIGSGFYETPSEAGYRVAHHLPKIGKLILIDKVSGAIEHFAKAPNYAGWAIQYRGTQWEFVASYPKH